MGLVLVYRVSDSGWGESVDVYWKLDVGGGLYGISIRKNGTNTGKIMN